MTTIPSLPFSGQQLRDTLTALDAADDGKVGADDARLSDTREWSATTISQAEAEAGTATTRRAFTAQRVFQSVAAWWAASAAKSKLDGIASGATANASDAALLSRANHTGTQSASTVTGLGSAAFLSVGTTAGTVAAGDDPRFSGVGGAIIHPGYPTFADGALIAPPSAAGALSAASALLQRVVYHPIYIPSTQTFTQILCRTNTTYTGSADVHLGVYSHDATKNRPLNKVYDSGLLQITASGQANYGPAPISLTLNPGFYWLAFLASAVGAGPSFMGTALNARGVGYPWFTEFTTSGTIVPYVIQNSQSALPAVAATTLASGGSGALVFLGV